MSKLENFLAQKDQDSLIVELSDSNMENISGGGCGFFNRASFGPQLAVQPTTQTNAASIGGNGSVVIDSPIIQPQIAISIQNLFQSPIVISIQNFFSF